MKKLITVLSFMILGCILPVSLVIGQSENSPHENPSNTSGLFDEVSLLLTYSRIFYMASIGDYGNAKDALNELSEIEIPEEIQYIIERYNDLSRQLFDTLDSLEEILNKTADLIETSQINEASKNLDDAEILAKQAESLLDDLSTTIDLLNEQLGTFLEDESSAIQKANSRLADSIKQIQQLLNNLAELRSNLNAQYSAALELQPTLLSLGVTHASAYLGESVMISGNLSSKDNPLTGKKIEVLLGGNIVKHLITGEAGTYFGSITIPYEYVDSMIFQTRYDPQGEDMQIYRGSQSQSLEINTLYYDTELSVTTPAVIYPEVPFNLSGEIITEANSIQRTVRISSGDADLGEFEVADVFNIAIAIPGDSDIGMQTITVTVEPQEKYAGTTQDIEISVALMSVFIDMEKPPLVVLPGLVTLSGIAYQKNGPLANAAVTVTISDKSVSVPTSPDGSFNAKLYLPLDISFIGQRNLTIDIDSLEPWNSDLQTGQQIMVINPAGGFLVLLASLALAVFISRRWWRSLQKDNTKSVTFNPEIIENPVILSVIKPSGVTGRIIAAYRAFLNLVERICGIRLVPSMTLREFLESVIKLLPSVTRPLTSLTEMMEKAIYSNQEPTQETALAAEQLTVNIKEEIDHEAS